MKNSIAHLPQEIQNDLERLVKLILERIPKTEMIILYGSYATGKYVESDTRIEFGIHTSYMSDYDILVVTDKAQDKLVGQKLDNIEEIYFRRPEQQTPVQFINEEIKSLNKKLSDGRYFYTQIKTEGIFLYNSERFKLARRRKLNYDEIKQQAEEYFEEKFNRAQNKLKLAKFAANEELYQDSIFLLHQAAENLFYAVRLVYTLDNKKQHNLSKLLSSVRKYSDQFQIILSHETKEDKRLFELLKAAYIEARYNPKFAVTKEDIDALTPLAERLSNLVKELCEKRIKEYGEMK